MTWAGALTALEAALNTAAATVNALDTSKEPFDVHAGESLSALTRQIRYWYMGDEEDGNTLSSENVNEKVIVRWHWPVPNRDDRWIGDLEVQLQAANRATHAALLADTHLGEHAIALRIDDCTTGWQQVGEAWVRVLSIPIRIELAATAVISN
jgi:hypothetical protein